MGLERGERTADSGMQANSVHRMTTRNDATDLEGELFMTADDNHMSQNLA